MSNILLKHFKTAGVCPSGLRRFLIVNYGMSNSQIQDIFDNGIELDRFNQLMGFHIKAVDVIKAWELDNGRK